MKKLFISLALAVLAVSASAQISKPVSWGFRGGLNLTGYTNQTPNNEYSFPPLLGFYLGAVAEWNDVFSNFGIRAELDFAAQGAEMKAKVEDAIFIERNYNLLVPVMLEYAFLDDKLRVMAGPQLGLCLGGSSTAKSAGTSVKESWDKNDYNTFDFSLVFGAEYMFIDCLGVELRYDLGLTSVFASSNKSTCYGNHGLQVGAIYKF